MAHEGAGVNSRKPSDAYPQHGIPGRLGYEQSLDRSELTTQVAKRAGQAMSQVCDETQFDARAEKIKARPKATLALPDEPTGSTLLR